MYGGALPIAKKRKSKMKTISEADDDEEASEPKKKKAKKKKVHLLFKKLDLINQLFKKKFRT